MYGDFCGYINRQPRISTIYSPTNQIVSDGKKLCGQENRSSMNFRVENPGTYMVYAPEGVSFKIKKDNSFPLENFGKDTDVATDVENGTTVEFSIGGECVYYIANPKGSNNKGFLVLFEKI